MLISIKIFSEEQTYEKYHHPHYKLCHKTVLSNIWTKLKENLPNEQNIERLTENWDSLGFSWNQNDILGCIIPHNPGKVCPNFL